MERLLLVETRVPAGVFLRSHRSCYLLTKYDTGITLPDFFKAQVLHRARKRRYRKVWVGTS